MNFEKKMDILVVKYQKGWSAYACLLLQRADSGDTDAIDKIRNQKFLYYLEDDKTTLESFKRICETRIRNYKNLGKDLSGCKVTLYCLGVFYKSLKDLKTSADLGFTPALSIMGGRYHCKYAKTKKDEDYQLSKGYLKKAIELGHINASVYLGILYEKKYENEKKDKYITKSHKSFRRATKNGSTFSMITKASRFKIGYLVEKDVAKAITYFKMAIDNGHTRAYEYLGGIYLRDENLKNVEKAIWCFGKCLKYHPDDMVYLDILGQMYQESGNMKKAFECYGRVVARGDKKRVMRDLIKESDGFGIVDRSVNQIALIDSYVELMGERNRLEMENKKKDKLVSEMKKVITHLMYRPGPGYENARLRFKKGTNRILKTKK